MIKNSMIAFRNSLNGYNKSDVNDYIQKLNSDFADYEKASNAAFEAIKLELENAKTKYAELDNLHSTLEEALQSAADKDLIIEEKNAEIAVLNDKIRHQEEQISSLAAERDKLFFREKELNDRVSNMGGANVKSERYDEISSQLGEIIISAKKAANEIIANAQAESDKLKEETREMLLAAREEAEKRAGDAMDSINKILHSMVEDTLGEIALYVKEAQFEMSGLLANMQVRNNEMGEKFKFINNKSVEGIKGELEKIKTVNLLCADNNDAHSNDDENVKINEAVTGYLDKTEIKEI